MYDPSVVRGRIDLERINDLRDFATCKEPLLLPKGFCMYVNGHFMILSQCKSSPIRYSYLVVFNLLDRIAIGAKQLIFDAGR